MNLKRLEDILSHSNQTQPKRSQMGFLRRTPVYSWGKRVGPKFIPLVQWWRWSDFDWCSVCTQYKFTPSPFKISYSITVASFSLLRQLEMVFSCLETALTTGTPPVVFQSSAAALGSSPAAVGRCSVSRCPGSVTAGRHARTRVTSWTVPVSIALLSPFTPTLSPNIHNMIDLRKEAQQPGPFPTWLFRSQLGGSQQVWMHPECFEDALDIQRCSGMHVDHIWAEVACSVRANTWTHPSHTFQPSWLLLSSRGGFKSAGKNKS